MEETAGGLTAMYGFYRDSGGRWAGGGVTFSTWGIKVAYRA